MFQALLIKTQSAKKSIFESFRLAAVLQAKRPELTNSIQVSKTEMKVSKTDQEILVNESLEQAELHAFTYNDPINNSFESVKGTRADFLCAKVLGGNVFTLMNLNNLLLCECFNLSTGKISPVNGHGNQMQSFVQAACFSNISPS